MNSYKLDYLFFFYFLIQYSQVLDGATLSTLSIKYVNIYFHRTTVGNFQTYQPTRNECINATSKNHQPRGTKRWTETRQEGISLPAQIVLNFPSLFPKHFGPEPPPPELFVELPPLIVCEPLSKMPMIIMSLL